MKTILYAFSLIYIAAGVCMILYTDETRNVFKRLVQMGLKAMSVIAFVMGLLLILAAPASHYPWFFADYRPFCPCRRGIAGHQSPGHHEQGLWMVSGRSIRSDLQGQRHHYRYFRNGADLMDPIDGCKNCRCKLS